MGVVEIRRRPQGCAAAGQRVDYHSDYHLPQDDALFRGDTILGDSSASVRNLTQYMESLRSIPSAPVRVAWYIRHR